MALETASYINGLVSTNPTGADPLAQADDHIRLLKATLKATFPNITGQMTATHTDLSNVLPKTGGTMTGDLTLANAPTTGMMAATKTYVDNGLAAQAPYLVPSGTIVMWSGTVASIPSGWRLCDGTLGTPDLRNKFVIGADVDVTGQSTSSVTGVSTKSGGSKDSIVVSHTHTMDTQGSHDHSIPAPLNNGADAWGDGDVNTANAWTLVSKVSTIQTGTAGSHVHTIATTGSSGTNANLPPYFALAFIMKA